MQLFPGLSRVRSRNRTPLWGIDWIACIACKACKAWIASKACITCLAYTKYTMSKSAGSPWIDLWCLNNHGWTNHQARIYESLQLLGVLPCTHSQITYYCSYERAPFGNLSCLYGVASSGYKCIPVYLSSSVFVYIWPWWECIQLWILFLIVCIDLCSYLHMKEMCPTLSMYLYLFVIGMYLILPVWLYLLVMGMYPA